MLSSKNSNQNMLKCVIFLIKKITKLWGLSPQTLAIYPHQLYCYKTF